jgi:hypothetical protein
MELLRAGLLYRAEADGTSLIFNTETADVHVVNRTGTLILEGMQRGNSIKTIVDGLVERFDVPRDIAETHTYEFLDTMRTGGFLESSHPTTSR